MRNVRGDGLRSGRTLSCGCLGHSLLAHRNRTHGAARSPEYRVWQQLRQRCQNPKDAAYENYGGRGITVCARWDASFEAFLADMGRRPSQAHSIDRIDNDGPYEPTNCRWSIPAVQHRNHRGNTFFEFKGQKLTVTDWAALIGIAPPTLTARLKRGWSMEKALTTPPRAEFRHRTKANFSLV